MIDAATLRAIYFYGEIEENWLGHQMTEIYKDQIYHPYLPLLKEGTTAIDIGGNIGLVSIYLSRYFERVITLEPSEEHFDALTRNLQSNNITNVKPIKKAVYIRDGEFPFGGPKDNRTMRSLHMATWQNGKNDETVEAITLDRLFEDEKIEKVNLLKCDCEGSEYELFAHSSFIKVAPKIDTVIVERHSWGGRNPHQLIDAFKIAGYKLEAIPNQADLLVARR